ncbi:MULTISPECIES: ABC-type transport auxiliary lipoprotein family protein [unclassified Duganella]|uniref:ABC-type transport auxiliary lipoprotein family protein n=1 Tax=unclassified Duganella TaxID=2636909 RepID=UPI000E34DC49|nr:MULTISPECIES: ABC-type transport auxiliary lipoprotein family protein [unclassified Duganella]RFP07951.1 ABC transporter [Duganella sp. BJB475]RFP21026.1 ABC transporter [Duganella sp. BJB476]
MTTAIRNAILVAALGALLGACASKGQTTAQYDFGPLPQTQTPAQAPAAIGSIIVADIVGPAALDTERMQYRLLYADARQSRPYAYNQWTATPFQLMTQRMKARIAQAGVKVLSTTDAAASPTVLRMEVNDFAQNFDSATSSAGIISLRASLFRNHKLVDQKTFSRSSPAPSPDAAGGAHALAASTDAVTADVLAWLTALPPQ